MVLRLFVPPGEGQHRLVPKRPDAIGANATLQTSIVSSTLLAAVYTAFAATFNQRIAPQQAISLSRPALLVRSSARLGLCVGLAGAAVNWYYYSAFANVVVAHKVPEAKKWRLYEWTKRYTVDDGAWAGAALGLSASVLMRRRCLGIPRWTRCVGMANLGACAGVLGAHAYLEYTGERQQAYRRFDACRRRRSLEFWAIFWDKELMARLSPIMQQYVRHNGVWYTQLLPDDVFERMDDEADEAAVQTTKPVADSEASPAEQKPDLPFYFEPVDYTADLKQIDVESTQSRIEQMQVEKEILLEEAEYLLFINAHQRREYCHMHATLDADERLRRLQEIHLVDVAYTRLRTAADTLDMKMLHWRMSLQHKAAWEKSSSSSLGPDDDTDWLPDPHLIDFSTHRPTLAALEIEKLQCQIGAEVQRFEQGSADARFARDKRERWRKDAHDGRVIVRAADHVLFRMQQAASTHVGDDHASGRGNVMPPAAALRDQTSADHVHPVNESQPTPGDDPSSDDVRLRKQVEQSRAGCAKGSETAPGQSGRG